jgi:hypothetical protein
MFPSHGIGSRDRNGPSVWKWTRLVGISPLLCLAAACGQSNMAVNQGPGATSTPGLPTAISVATVTPAVAPIQTPSPSLSLIVKPTSITQACDSALDPLPAQTITLDNTPNNVAVNWDALMHKFNYGGTWETSNPSYGTVPAHAVVTFILTPVPNLCKEIQQAGLTGDVTLRLDVEVTSGNGVGVTVLDTVHAYSP